MTPLTPQEKKVFLFISFVLLLGLSLSYFKKTTGCNVCLIDIYGKKTLSPVELNTATRGQLLKIRAIGPKTADDILALRARMGGFKSIEELKAVKGLSEEKIANLREFLYIK